MEDNIKRAMVPICSENIGKPNSFTIAINAKTNELYTFEEKQMKASIFVPLFFAFLLFTRLFSVKYIPFNSLVIYTILSVLLFGVFLVCGNIMRIKGIKNIKKASLSKQEWENYQSRGRRFYLRQVFLVCFMLILSTVCFVCLYMYQSKWWFIGAMFSSLVAGSLLPLISRTRYLLYKNKLDVHFNYENH